MLIPRSGPVKTVLIPRDASHHGDLSIEEEHSEAKICVENMHGGVKILLLPADALRIAEVLTSWARSKTP